MAVFKVGVLILTEYILGVYAFYHWKVTENGRISSQVENSGFPLRRQDDLMAFLEQDHKLQAVNKLYKQLLSLKDVIDVQWGKIEQEGDVEKRLYSSDIDCLLGKVPLSQHNLNTEFLDYCQGSRPKMKNSHKTVQPDCTNYSTLDFSMRTFPHLKTLGKRTDLNLSVNPVPSKAVMDLNIDAMLRVNTSDWTAYNIASLYWRTMGNATNALECAKRALYFSPRNQRYLVLLNLGTLLHQLQSLGEAAIVLHSAVDHDPEQEVTHLALGNVYAALGDYKRSLACYDNVLSLNPRNLRAFHLKHALICHKKLETGLFEIHNSLQKILKDLQKYNSLLDEWIHLRNKVNWERDSQLQEFFSLGQPIHLNLQTLLQNVENQAKTLNEEVSKRVTKKEVSQTNKKGRKSIEKWEKTFDLEDIVQSAGSIELSEEEESELENFLGGGGEYLFKDKMSSLITFIKTNYEEINLLDFKKKMNEEFSFLNKKNFFSMDRPFSSSNMGACVKRSNNVKKLN